MLDVFFDNGGMWFAIPAFVGTGVFIIRLALMVTGAAGADLDVDIDHGGGHGHADSTSVFKAITFQSIMAFAMGFGWGGLAGLKGLGWGFAGSMAVGVACGVGMVWVLTLLLKAIHDLSSSGNIAIENTIGRQGEVYVSIPPKGEGRGQVKVIVSDRLRIFNAESESSGAPTQSRVKIVAVNDDHSLRVVPM